YEQHAAFAETRIAARENLARQMGIEKQGLLEFLNVLQAITSWGNAVSAQAQSLSQYNTELATIELQTGTILESHGIRFVQERKRFLSPIGFNREQYYPSAILPTENNMKYPDTGEPAEDSFNLESPLDSKSEIILPEPMPEPDLNPIDVKIPDPPQGAQKQLLNGAINSTVGDLSLLVPQSIDRIQSAGLPSGIKTEKDTDTSSK
ncbi:MAG: hypothetical protein JKY95_16310, partial [Planctomycetaceae bacterium]|nr:hypothetical protein [Planctomycetaceae bacterium]